MDPRTQTSFIPKKPIVNQTSTRSAEPINLFSLIATILFVVSLALGGGAYFYQNLIGKQIESSRATLERAKGAFEPELINQIVRLDNRIETAKNLLNGHIAVTPLFDFVSSVTLTSVRFKDFSFNYLSPDKILVTMNGQGQSYASVALQSDLFNEQKYLSETLVEDMTLDPSGLVNFSVSTVISPDLLSYREALSRGSVTSQQTQ
jgi:hypothetical protein